MMFVLKTDVSDNMSMLFFRLEIDFSVRNWLFGQKIDGRKNSIPIEKYFWPKFLKSSYQ